MQGEALDDLTSPVELSAPLKPCLLRVARSTTVLLAGEFAIFMVALPRLGTLWACLPALLMLGLQLAALHSPSLLPSPPSGLLSRLGLGAARRPDCKARSAGMTRRSSGAPAAAEPAHVRSLLQRYELPELVVFDLDYTLWPFVRRSAKILRPSCSPQP